MELAYLGDLIFDIKDKISDDEFLNIMNQLHKLHRKYERIQDDNEDYDDGYDEDGNYVHDYPDTEYGDDYRVDHYSETQSILRSCPSHAIYNSNYAYIWIDIHHNIHNFCCYCPEYEMRCSANNICCIHYKSMCQTVPGMTLFFSRKNKHIHDEPIHLSSEIKELDSAEKINRYHKALLTYMELNHTIQDKSLLVLILMSYTMNILPPYDKAPRLRDTILDRLLDCKGPIERNLATFDYRNIIDNSIEEISSTIDHWIAYLQV